MNHTEEKKQEHSGIISSVEKLVNKAIKEKAFTPMDFKFPNFSIDKAAHIKLVKELVQRKVRVNFIRGDYRSKTLLNRNENFDDLLINEINGNKDQRLTDIAQKVLPIDLDREKSFSPSFMQAISRSAIIRGLDIHTKAVLLKVHTLKNGQGSAFDNELPMDAERQIDALAADLIYLKFNNPIAFREIETQIQASLFDDAKEPLLKEIANPSKTTLTNLNNFDPQFVQKNFTRDFMELSSNNDMASKIHKIRAFAQPEVKPKQGILKRMFA